MKFKIILGKKIKRIIPALEGKKKTKALMLNMATSTTLFFSQVFMWNIGV